MKILYGNFFFFDKATRYYAVSHKKFYLNFCWFEFVDCGNVQVGNFIHYLSTFLAGLVVGFVSAWRLALLSVAVIPGIAFAGGLYAYTLTGLTSKSRESYANAGIIAEQVRLNSWLNTGNKLLYMEATKKKIFHFKSMVG